MENENKEKRAKSDETDGRNDPTDLRNNKKMPNKKEKKKIREYRKLKASESSVRKFSNPTKSRKSIASYKTIVTLYSQIKILNL